MYCVKCRRSIDAANDSREHLIANAIGGRLKVRGVLCGKCNSVAGEDWDSELAEQLHPLSLLFAVKRERGEVPYREVVTAAGDALYLRNDGSLQPVPVYRVHRDGADTRIELRVETLEQAKEILSKLKERRYPKLDIEKALASGEVREEFNNIIKFELPFGGPKAGRAAVKSALCLAVSCGVPAGVCADAIEYLRDPDGFPCFGMFFEREVILNRPSRVPLHCVAVSSRDSEGQLLAYLEYYGVHRLVVRLAENFSGPEKHCCYAINPVTAEELQLDFNIGVSRADVNRCFDYGCMPPGSRDAAFDNVMPLAMEINRKRAWENAFAKGLRFGWDNCGAAPGEQLTIEHTRRITELMMQNLRPFLVHNLGGNRLSHHPATVPKTD